MNTPITRLFFLFCLTLFWNYTNSCIHAQEVQQITSGESQHYDSNYEEFFNINGIGYYSSYIDDKIKVFRLDTKEEIYSTTFDLCEEEILRWIIVDSEIVYVGYTRFIIDNLLQGTSEVYNFDDILGDIQGTTVYGNDLSGIISLVIYPGPHYVYFDLDRRNLIENTIYNLDFVSNDFIYHSIGGLGANDFIRINRSTNESDTLLSDYSQFSYIRSEDNYFLATEEYPLRVIDKNDNVKVYDFDHGRIESAVETSSGRLILSEIINGGTILYELDIESTEFIRKDTILADKTITLLDSYQDRLYVQYSTQFDEYYGYLDYPYTEVDILTEDPKDFTKYYVDKSQDLIAVESYSDALTRDIFILEKSTGEIHKFEFMTSSLWLDDVIDVTFTTEGIRLVVSEPMGKAIYTYDSISNTFSPIHTIDNNRGLGTEVQKNEDSYLIANEHSLHPGFEYLHPDTKELTYHQVDGIIHGNVIPYEGRFFYIRNQNFQGQDENFILDFVMFDPSSGDIELIEENFFYPNNNVSFANINHTNYDYGFLFIYNSTLIFNLKTQSTLNVNLETRDLLRTIYFESDNYFYSYTGNPEQKHYKIDKSNFEIQELSFEGEYRRLREVDDNSFVATFPDAAYFVEEEQITSLNLPLLYTPSFAGTDGKKLFLGGFDGTNTILKIIDLSTYEETDIDVEGYIIDFIGEYIISLLAFEPSYELKSTNLFSGDSYLYTIDEYSKLYSTDSTIYFLDKELNEITVLDLEWNEITSISTPNYASAEFKIISKPNDLPVIFRVQHPNTGELYKNLPDYSLATLDPRVNTLTEYFECGSSLRFNKELEIGPVSTLLLRTEDQGYQIHEVEFPGFVSVSTEEATLEEVEVSFISPNPTHKNVIIHKAYKKGYLFNSMGQLLETYKNENLINLEMYSNGIYFLNLTLENGKTSTAKIIKQ